MISYKPYKKHAPQWENLRKAMCASTIEEALKAASSDGFTETTLATAFQLSRWTIRSACTAYNIKLPDGRL